MTSIERTAYPQFRRLVSARVLHVFFSPAEDEVAWARERTETLEALLAGAGSGRRESGDRRVRSTSRSRNAMLSGGSEASLAIG